MINFFWCLGQFFRIVVILYQKAAQVWCASHHSLADNAFIRRIGWTPSLLQRSGDRLGHISAWMSWTKWKCRKEAHVPYVSWWMTWIGMSGLWKTCWTIHVGTFFSWNPARDILQQSFPTGQGGSLPVIIGVISPHFKNWKVTFSSIQSQPFITWYTQMRRGLEHLELGESAKQLDCEHCFHSECPWKNHRNESDVKIWRCFPVATCYLKSSATCLLKRSF